VSPTIRTHAVKSKLAISPSTVSFLGFLKRTFSTVHVDEMSRGKHVARMGR
jgi:hypothetical protein